MDRGDTNEWRARPWLMAAIGALGGLIFWLLVRDGLADDSPARQAAATFVMVAVAAFLITADRPRLAWAAAFSGGWGAVIALVGFYTASYNRGGEIAEFPFLSALLAVLIAAPLFQTIRDEGRPALPYARLHNYVWSDAIIGAASLAFTGLTFLLFLLVSEMFRAIGIDALRDLLDTGWFAWLLAGGAFGAASATLRTREALLTTLQRLVTLVTAILAPALAAALVLFLLALPVTGFAGLWRSGLPETPMLLAAAAFAFALLNAIIGESPDDRRPGALWRLTEAGLSLAILPLGVLALVSMMMRVDQYGWTPERIWGVVACLVAIVYGLANVAAWARARARFDEPLRDYQKWLAVGLSATALLLALPIVDFGAVSARSQLARLETGRVAPDRFDWAAMAFDFGPAGRRALERIATLGPDDQRRLASRALQSRARYAVREDVALAEAEAGLDRRVRIATPGLALDDRLRLHLARSGRCAAPQHCTLVAIDQGRVGVISVPAKGGQATAEVIDVAGLPADRGIAVAPAVDGVDLAKVADPHGARIEVRAVTRRQIFVDGQPVGRPFE